MRLNVLDKNSGLLYTKWKIIFTYEKYLMLSTILINILLNLEITNDCENNN